MYTILNLLVTTAILTSAFAANEGTSGFPSYELVELKQSTGIILQLSGLKHNGKCTGVRVGVDSSTPSQIRKIKRDKFLLESGQSWCNILNCAKCTPLEVFEIGANK